LEYDAKMVDMQKMGLEAVKEMMMGIEGVVISEDIR